MGSKHVDDAYLETGVKMWLQYLHRRNSIADTSLQNSLSACTVTVALTDSFHKKGQSTASEQQPTVHPRLPCNQERLIW